MGISMTSLGYGDRLIVGRIETDGSLHEDLVTLLFEMGGGHGTIRHDVADGLGGMLE
jgi:hypothetical protein